MQFHCNIEVITGLEILQYPLKIPLFCFHYFVRVMSYHFFVTTILFSLFCTCHEFFTCFSNAKVSNKALGVIFPGTRSHSYPIRVDENLMYGFLILCVISYLRGRLHEYYTFVKLRTDNFVSANLKILPHSSVQESI